MADVPSLKSLVAKEIGKWPRDRFVETLQFRFIDSDQRLEVTTIPGVNPAIEIGLSWRDLEPALFDPAMFEVNIVAFFVRYRDMNEYGQLSGIGRKALDIAITKLIEHYKLDPRRVILAVHPDAGTIPHPKWPESTGFRRMDEFTMEELQEARTRPQRMQDSLKSYYSRLGFSHRSGGGMTTHLNSLRLNLQRMTSEPPPKRQRT